jgi:hypothetical protein
VRPSLRGGGPSFPTGATAIGDRRNLDRQQKIERPRMSARPTTPPTTPPAIAPVFELLLEDGGVAKARLVLRGVLSVEDEYGETGL